jgi:putative ABC transport system substrate-binding protein
MKARTRVTESSRARADDRARARGPGWLSVLGMATLAAVTVCIGAQSASDRRVALLVESRASMYQQAALGFEKEFAGAGQIHKIYLDEACGGMQPMLEVLRRDPPNLVVTIGTQAAKTARKNLPNVPLLYCLALRPRENNLAGRNVGGITLEVELSRKLEDIRKVLPNVRRIGVVYDDLTSGELVERAQQYLGSEIRLIPRVARTRQEASQAIQDLLSTALSSEDAFWLLWDPVVANPANFKQLVELSLQYKVPLIAPARPFVEAGALLSIEPNYRKAGEQAGRLARQVLNGELQLANVREQPPQEIVITVNGGVEQRLGISLPKNLRMEVLEPPQWGAAVGAP